MRRPPRERLRAIAAPCVYKFSSPDRLGWLQAILLDHQLYFPSPEELNDPRDARPPLRIRSREHALKAIVSSYVIQYSQADLSALAAEVRRIHDWVSRAPLEYLEEQVTRSFHEQMNRHRIYSLTVRPDNEHLWTRYAADHRGYCLEFSTSSWPFSMAHHVVYRGEVLPTFEDEDSFDADILFRKTPAWSAEEEVRVILLPRGQPHEVTFDPTPLRRIILGSRMATDHRLTIRDWAQQRIPQLRVEDESFDLT